MAEILHFWYSEQSAAQEDEDRTGACYVKLESGEIVRYTECSERERPASSWPDLKYLGIGQTDHITPADPNSLFRPKLWHEDWWHEDWRRNG